MSALGSNPVSLVFGLILLSLPTIMLKCVLSSCWVIASGREDRVRLYKLWTLDVPIKQSQAAEIKSVCLGVIFLTSGA